MPDTGGTENTGPESPRKVSARIVAKSNQVARDSAANTIGRAPLGMRRDLGHTPPALT